MKNKNLLIGGGCAVGGILMILLSDMLLGTVLYPLSRLAAVVLIIVGIVFIIKSFIGKKEDTAAAAPEAVRLAGDDALSAQICDMQKKKNICFALIAVPVVLLFFSGSFPFAVPILLIVAILVLFGAGMIQADKLKKFVSESIVQKALEDVFDGITYHSGRHISDSYVHASNMGLPRFDRIEGSDYVKGTYKGLRIEMSDVTLIEEEITTDEDGNQQRNDHNVFRGLWLVCDFGKTLSADMRLWEWGGLRFTNKGIQTDNEQFNKTFRVESEVPVEAFYILTPHMMEYILGMKSRAGGHIHMCFARDGKVQIAVDSGRDSFEVSGRETDASALRQKFVSEIRYVTDIIDELRLVDTLYKT